MMTKEIARTLPNWITFPQSLRDAIRRVSVKLRACETGKLDGAFDISISLNVSAAEALAELLRTAVEQAKQ